MTCFNNNSGSRLSFLILVPAIVVALLLGPAQSQVDAQGSKALPKRIYYEVFEDFYDGNYRDCKRNFISLSRGANIIVSGKFLDSVIYWTMLGESHYRLGEYGLALEQYQAALDLYLSLQQWPNRTTFPNRVEESQEATRRASEVTWAASTRTPRYGAFNQSMLIRLGKSPAENEAALRRGGVVDPERLQSIDIVEVMRCVSLAVYRYNEIKGPIATMDPFTSRLTTNLAGTGGASMQGAWMGIPKGIALAGKGDYVRAASILRSSLKVGGYDHPLTPLALLTLGKIAAAQEQAEAQQLFMEASIAGVAFQQYDVVEEAIRYGAVVHAASRSLKPYQPIISIMPWAQKENKNMLQASLATTGAMVAAESGDVNSATRLLQSARREMNRNDIARTDVHTRWLYIDAMVNYLKQDTKRGDAGFVDFQKAAQATSRWLFQIAIADNAVKAGVVTERESENLYDLLLREPTDLDWKYRPEEVMAFLTTPHGGAMERWFTVALSRKAEEKAIGIAENIRRHRFFIALPLGGRLLSLRWVLEAPEEALTQKAFAQKTVFFQRYPDYKVLSDRGEELRKQLEQLPVAPDKESDEFQTQKRLLGELAEVVDGQEKFLRMIALVRDPCEMAFPQPLSVPQIQQKLRPGQVIVTFLRAGNLYYVMKLSGARYTIEGQFQAKQFDKKVLQLTKAIHVGDKSAIIDPEEFADEKWKVISRELSQLIFAKTEPQAIDSMDELIFVPDGKAWYLPMELLQVGTPENSQHLGQKVRIRYAPMAALAVPDQRVPKRFRRSAIVADRNFIRDDSAQVQQALADIQSALPEMELFEKTVQGSSALLASVVDQLVVWHLSNEKSKAPFSFSPTQVNAGRNGERLDSWMLLPWRGVDQMVLSGVSSWIEGPARSRADGSDLFLSTMAMMASGSRTILISRWRVGGQTTLDLTREFTMELGKTSASKAWQRSVDLLRDSEIDNSAEPRLREKLLDQPMTGDHPFFWSGYMLLDTGYEPSTEKKSTSQENSGG